MEENSKPRSNVWAIALICAFILFVTVFSTAGLASASSIETSQWEANTSSCTINAGSSGCSFTFTWPTPLSGTPCVGCATVSLQGNLAASAQTIKLSSTVSFFDLSSTGQTWVGFPVNYGEIFGDAGQHWRSADTQAIATDTIYGDLVVDCVNSGGTLGTERLHLQYANEFNGWNNITGSDVDVSNSATTGCGFNLPDSCLLTTGVNSGCYPFTIPAGAILGVPNQNSENPWFRIMGYGGNGVEAITFISAQLKLMILKTVQPVVTPSIGTPTATQLPLTAKINVIQSVATIVNLKFSAWVCLKGGSGPC